MYDADPKSMVSMTSTRPSNRNILTMINLTVNTSNKSLLGMFTAGDEHACMPTVNNAHHMTSTVIILRMAIIFTSLACTHEL